MLVELHLIQNFAPSNLNRDESGAPKECEFGGYRRARISSQAIKRAIRNVFKAGLLPDSDRALRTKRLVEEMTDRLVARGRNAEQAAAVARAALASLPAPVDKDDKTEYLFFVGNREIDGLVAVCHDHWDLLVGVTEGGAAEEETGSRTRRAAKKAAKESVPAHVRQALLECLSGGKAADLALFGRMLADLPDRNIDAAAQVAHAISTHTVDPEFDFYTAVDDLKKDDTAGADMMGSVQFNSACFYRYANLDLVQLSKNLDGDAAAVKDAVEAFLRASITAIPTGKQNSMAAQNPPSLVFAVVREAGLWSLANAFVRPVYPDDTSDLVEKSVVALDRYWGRMARMYGTGTVRRGALATLEEVDLTNLSGYQVESVDQVVQAVNETVTQWLGEVAGGR